MILQKWENNGTEEIGLVTPTLGQQWTTNSSETCIKVQLIDRLIEFNIVFASEWLYKTTPNHDGTSLEKVIINQFTNGSNTKLNTNTKTETELW